MSGVQNHSDGDDERRSRELTGRTVLFCLVAFFAVVAGVNAVMMTAAMTTFGGVETNSSYQAGLLFAREEEAAEAQQMRHWRVNAILRPDAGGKMHMRDSKDRSDRGRRLYHRQPEFPYPWPSCKAETRPIHTAAKK